MYGRWCISSMRRSFDALRKIEFVLGALGLVISILLTFCQVVNRYWLHYEIMWIGDLALYVFIFTIYVGISYGAAIKTHICVDILPDALCGDDEIRRAWYDLFKDLLTIAMIVSLWGPMWRAVRRAWRYPEYASIVRWFNISWLSYAMGAMAVLTVLHYAWHACSDIFEIRKACWEARHVKEAGR